MFRRWRQVDGDSLLPAGDSALGLIRFSGHAGRRPRALGFVAERPIERASLTLLPAVEK
jgi:hypothetical protein